MEEEERLSETILPPFFESLHEFLQEARLIKVPKKLLRTSAEQEYSAARREFEILLSLPPSNSELLFTSVLETLYKKGENLRKERYRRILDVFCAMDAPKRPKRIYTMAIRAALCLGDSRNVDMLYSAAKDCGATIPNVADLIQNAIRQEQWLDAMRMFEAEQKRRDATFSRKSIARRIWISSDGETMQDHVKQAMSFLQYQESDAFKSEVKKVEAKPLLRQLLLRCFTTNYANLAEELFTIGSTRMRTLFANLVEIGDLSGREYRTTIRHLLTNKNADFIRLAMDVYSHLTSNIQHLKDQDPHEYADRNGITKLEPPVQLLDSLMDALKTKRNFKAMGQVFDDYQHFHGKPSVAAFRSYLSELAWAGNSTRAHQIFDEFCNLYGKPEGALTYFYVLLLKAYAQAWNPRSMEKVFRDLKSTHRFTPTLPCYNVMIDMYQKLGDAEAASDWFDQITDSGLTPDGRSYTNLMLLFARRGDVDTVAGLMEDCETSGVPTNIFMINILVQAHIQNDDLEAAGALLETSPTVAEKEGSRTRMWNYVIEAYAIKGDLVKASALYTRMQELGVQHNEYTLGALMYAVVLTNAPQSAYKIMRKHLAKEHLPARSFHYVILMRGFNTTREYSEVFKLYQEMIQLNIPIDAYVRDALIRAAAALTLRSNPTSHTQEHLNAIVEHAVEESKNAPQPSNARGLFAEGRTTNVASTFAFLTYLFGSRRAFDEVHKLWDTYTKTIRSSRPNIDTSPPLLLLSNLMISLRLAKDDTQMEKCWNLVREKAEPLARGYDARYIAQLTESNKRKMFPPQTQPKTRSSREREKEKGKEKNFVVPSRRNILALPLFQYALHLKRRSQPAKLEALLISLESDGYAISSQTWNVYVCTLALSASEKDRTTAFQRCEFLLMQHWTGWPDYSFGARIRNKLLKLQPDLRRGRKGEHRAPEYRTLVILAGAWLELGSKYGFDDSVEVFRRLKEVAPKTVAAIEEMPRIDDRWQLKYLEAAS
ncbi:hypothetical protein MMC25_007150 [Agyrium rufum]|nr:hypothetical protein [Agyrium rufum]